MMSVIPWTSLYLPGSHVSCSLVVAGQCKTPLLHYKKLTFSETWSRPVAHYFLQFYIEPKSLLYHCKCHNVFWSRNFFFNKPAGTGPVRDKRPKINHLILIIDKDIQCSLELFWCCTLEHGIYGIIWFAVSLSKPLQSGGVWVPEYS